MATALHLLLLTALCGHAAHGGAAPLWAKKLSAPHAWENMTANHEVSPSMGTSRSTTQSPRGPGLGQHQSHRLLPVFQHRQSYDDNVMAPPDKKQRSKFAMDNNTGLRKTPRAGQSMRVSTGAFEKSHRGRTHNEDPNRFHPSEHKTLSASQDQPNLMSISANFYDLMDHESNRPTKINHHKLNKLSQNYSKPPAIINRQPPGLLFQLNAFRKGSDSRETVCLSESHKERDEREAYCNSDFAVNGFVHDVESAGTGIHLVTLLLNSAGLYKINRLYITPDGFFFRVKILAVDTARCPKSCLDFKLGGRYIVMGRIYHKRMELPAEAQQLLSGRLRAGDGLVGCSSYIKRFNRKKERKVLAVAHTTCQ